MSEHTTEEAQFTGLVVTQTIGPWEVHMEWTEGANQGGPSRIEIRPNPNASAEELAGGLSSTILRQVDFQAAGRKWRELAGIVSPNKREVEKRIQHELKVLRTSIREAAAKGIDENYLSTLSQAYVSLVNLGEKSVTSKLAELAGRQPETIKQHLKQARSHGLLTTVKGKAGGHLTPKAIEILGGGN